jgi:hypothetical protein
MSTIRRETMFVQKKDGVDRFHVQVRITTIPRKRTEFHGGTVYFQATATQPDGTVERFLVETTDYIGLDSTQKGDLVDLSGVFVSTEKNTHKVVADYLTVRT